MTRAENLLADQDRRLGLVGAVVAVLEPQTVPVDGGVYVALVLDVNDDLRPLLHLQDRPGDRSVVGQHPHGRVADPLGVRRDVQGELVAVRQLDQLRRARLRETGRIGGKVVWGGLEGARGLAHGVFLFLL